jgi:hypothetical protein
MQAFKICMQAFKICMQAFKICNGYKPTLKLSECEGALPVRLDRLDMLARKD